MSPVEPLIRTFMAFFPPPFADDNLPEAHWHSTSRQVTIFRCQPSLQNYASK